MSDFASPFLVIPPSQWVCSNDLAFAVNDGFPVSRGHVLVTTRRVVETWFDATAAEQAALMALVSEVKGVLDRTLQPKPDGYNVGFNSGRAAGQTVPHVHVHVIPRYAGDVPDPRGGVRHVIPYKGNYLSPKGTSSGAHESLALITGVPEQPLWRRLAPHVSGALELDLLASFVQESGLNIVQRAIFSALQSGGRIRILTGDYLYITSAAALKLLLGWMQAAEEMTGRGSLQVRLVEISKLPSRPESFHPKAWRILDDSGGLVVVGSSNLSGAALETGVEWNLITRTNGTLPIDRSLAGAFDELWQHGSVLDAPLVDAYARRAKEAHRKLIPAESIEPPGILVAPRPWQEGALASLARLRAESYRRALVAVATGLGKTWLAALDALALGKSLERAPRVLIVAHRAEILAQTEVTFRTSLRSLWPDVRVSWYLGADGDFSGGLVVASVQKLTRPEGLLALSAQVFDYAVIDEVHHAQAPSYRRVLARLNATFTIGLTATPERTDGVDVAMLFDDVLAWQATIGDGIAEGSLVPFHYIGLKDDVDFEQIPWRNGRFDPAQLEEKLENSERMNRLWSAWKQSTAARTLVFCCSRRHALYAREWLRRRGIRAAAVFSGTGGDSRSGSLAEFVAGAIEALCVVDLFNEGLDVPEVDRVVMLRPTESKIVFIQQLGRGLRAVEGKTRLQVIDFVGNHRMFASRLAHLLSLAGRPARWAELKRFLQGGAPDLPAGCLLDLELEARELMLQLVPKSGTAVVEAYRALRDDMGRRPTPTELLHRGYLPRTLAAQFDSWFGFVAAESDLSGSERMVADAHRDWLAMLETTALNKSYKMIVLRVLLDHDAFWDGMAIEPLAAACRTYLLAHPLLHHDLPPTKEFPEPAKAPIETWAAWWLEWPLSRWMDRQDGRMWFKRESDGFLAAFPCAPESRPAFEAMTAELVDFRLAQYAQRLKPSATGAKEASFVAKVSHAGGRPILWLPSDEELPNRPVGPTHVRLPGGESWIFRLVKIACNVAAPDGSEGNELPRLLRDWFGADAGAPGTAYKVGFHLTADGWTVAPIGVAAPAALPTPAQFALPSGKGTPAELLPGFIADVTEVDRFVRYVPVYNLEAAAGSWGAEMSPEAIGWAAPRDIAIKPGLFIARVRGRSMEPKIKDGTWCLFRRNVSGSRENRVVLVQFNSSADPDTGRFTVKRYHSEKHISEEGWTHEQIVLRPLNAEYDPIIVSPEAAAEMLVVGEFVAVVG